jgi:nitrite reductase/ring-hydroxylating ferredoxin subunit
MTPAFAPLPERPRDLSPQLLCEGSAIEEGGKGVVFDVLEYGLPARAFALRFEGQVVCYLNRCVHVPTELDWQPGEFFDADKRWIICSVHGATYEPIDGHCVGGPCGRGRLTAIRVEERDGQVYWYPSRDIQPLAFEPPAPPESP